jgi:hypothetical protein
MKKPDRILNRPAWNNRLPSLLLLAAACTHAATVYTGKSSTWNHYSASEYAKNREQYDESVKMVENAVPLLSQRFGSTLPMVTVNIIQGECKEIPTSISNKIQIENGCLLGHNMLYGKDVLLFYLVAIGTGNVSVGWHLGFLRPFSEMVILEVAREVLGAAPADSIMQSSGQAKTAAFATFRALKNELGWSFFQRFFSQVKTDALYWSEIGPDSSEVLMNYTVAYLSIAADRKLAPRLRDGGVGMVDPFETMKIITARAQLSASAPWKIDQAEAWKAFRKGHYEMVKDLIHPAK